MVFEKYFDNAAFFIYAVITLLGCIYIHIFVPETAHLSDKEKKEIMMPGAKYGRALKPGEKCVVGNEHKSRRTLNLDQVEPSGGDKADPKRRGGSGYTYGDDDNSNPTDM